MTGDERKHQAWLIFRWTWVGFWVGLATGATIVYQKMRPGTSSSLFMYMMFAGYLIPGLPDLLYQLISGVRAYRSVAKRSHVEM